MTSSSETTPTWTHIATTYDAVADDYADKFSDELDGKPFDRELLDQLARGVAGRGPVVDLGCGPGQIGAYLAASGCDVIGVDLAPGMIRSAREQHPDLRFELGDLRALPLADDSWAGCCATAAGCFSPSMAVWANTTSMIGSVRAWAST
jgi:SAM-dependent methyltransferase